MFYSFNYTVKSRGVCNQLPILYRDRHLEGSKTATLYINLQINITCRLPFPFQLSITPSLLPSSCIYIEPLELHLQSSCLCNSSHCKANILIPFNPREEFFSRVPLFLTLYY